MGLYVLGGVELIADVAGNDGTFAYVLVAHQHDLELLN